MGSEMCIRDSVGPLEDFDKGYRRRPTAEEMERWDPVARFEKEMEGLAISRQAREQVRQELEAQIDQSVRRAREAPFPPPEELYTDVLG